MCILLWKPTHTMQVVQKWIHSEQQRVLQCCDLRNLQWRPVFPMSFEWEHTCQWRVSVTNSYTHTGHNDTHTNSYGNANQPPIDNDVDLPERDLEYSTQRG